MYTYARRIPGPGGLEPPLSKIEKMSISSTQLKLFCLTPSQRVNLKVALNTPAAQDLSKRVLLATSAILIERFDVRDEHSANFASITELVFLRLILQHAGESSEDIARASLYEVHKHGPKIRTLPERIKSEECSWV